MNPLITRTPWLFWDIFKNLEDDVLLGIAEAGVCMALASVLIDHLADGQVPNPGLLMLFRPTLQDRGLSLYQENFPIESNFWVHYEHLSREYIAALQMEIDAQLKPDLFALENFIHFAGGKVTPMVITIAALTEASHQPDLLEPIEASMRCSYVAGQIHDDILDWEVDLEDQHLTYFLINLAPDNALKSGSWPKQKEIKLVNDKEWLDVKELYLAIEWFDRALEAVDGIDCPGWEYYLHEYRKVAEKDQQTALAAHLFRILESN